MQAGTVQRQRYMLTYLLDLPMEVVDLAARNRISTQKFYIQGPMGLDARVPKYGLLQNGQIRWCGSHLYRFIEVEHCRSLWVT